MQAQVNRCSPFKSNNSERLDGGRRSRKRKMKRCLTDRTDLNWGFQSYPQLTEPSSSGPHRSTLCPLEESSWARRSRFGPLTPTPEAVLSWRLIWATWVLLLERSWAQRGQSLAGPQRWATGQREDVWGLDCSRKKTGFYVLFLYFIFMKQSCSFSFEKGSKRSGLRVGEEKKVAGYLKKITKCVTNVQNQ